MPTYDPNDPRNPRNAPIASPPPTRPATQGQVAGAPAIGTSPVARFLAAPAVAAAPKPPRKPAAVTAFNAAATASDAMKAPYIGAVDATNRALVGARNFVREGLGKSPVQPAEFNYSPTREALAAARASNAAPATPKPLIAAPKVAFAGIDAEPTGMFKNPARQNRVRTAAELAQASRAEVKAQPSTTPALAPQTTTGDGASGYYIGGNGVRRDINPDGSIAGADPRAVPVNRQSFGTSSIAKPEFGTTPRLASTYGLSVTDPRLDDQNAASIARPTGTLRGPDQMAEQYNAREDREARQKAISDADSRRFRLELIEQHGGSRGRAATQALASLAEQQAALASGGERLSAEAQQNRAQRANQFGIASMEQAGQDYRAGLAADTAAMDDATRRYSIDRGADVEYAKIARPEQEFITGADNRRYLVAGNTASPIVDAAGAAIEMPGQTQRGQVTPELIYEGARAELGALLQQPAYGKEDDPAVQAYTRRVAALRQQIAMLEQGGQRTKPDLATFLARAKAKGSKMTEAQLKAAYATL